MAFYRKEQFMKFRILLITIIFLAACKENYTPKPRGYFRIDFPVKEYKILANNFPYSFEIPVYSKIVKDLRNADKPYWINLTVPENKVEVHFSYYNLQDQGKDKTEALFEFMEDTRSLAYKHSIKADAIEEQVFMNPARNIYGTIYKIEGNAASPMQFFLTDSTKHFLRGAFYIREVPDIDSLQPVIDFFEPDVIRMIETANWN